MIGRTRFPKSAIMHGGARRGMKGGGFMDFLRGANKFLRKTRLLSTVGGLAASAFPVLKAPAALAGMLGYGRRRRIQGGRRRLRRRM
jgi:hypothetical protein